MHTLFFFSYMKWHYTKAIQDLVRIVFNFVWFFYELFSITIFLKTFFSPFRRLGEGYGNMLNLSLLFQTFILNTLMRFVGVLLRSVFILLGCFFIIFSIAVGTAFLVAWVLTPLLLLFLLIFGFKLIVLP
jgi:hypothetical protein